MFFLRIASSPLRFLFKLAFFVAGLTLVLGVGGLVGCYHWLRTDAGQLWAGQKASALASHHLRGLFDIDRIRFGMREGLTLQGVRVKTDNRKDVAELQRFRIDIEWRSLLSRKVVVQELLLESPIIAWSPETALVFTLRNPSPPKPRSSENKPFELPVDLVVRSLRIFELQGSFEQPQSPVRTLLSPLTLQAQGTLQRNSTLSQPKLSYAFWIRAKGAGLASAEGEVSFSNDFASVLAASGKVEVLQFEPLRTVGNLRSAGSLGSNGSALTPLAGPGAVMPSDASKFELLANNFSARLNLNALYSWNPSEPWPTLQVQTFALQTSAGTLSANAAIDPNKQFQFQVNSSEIQLEHIPWSVFRHGLHVSGRVSLKAQGEGSPQSPEVKATLSACEVAVLDASVPPSLRGIQGRTSCVSTEAHTNFNHTLLKLQGHVLGVPLNLTAKTEINLLAKEAKPLAQHVDATFDFGPLPVGILASLWGSPLLKEAQGLLEASVRVVGTPKVPHISWKAWAHRLSFRKWKNIDVLFTGESLPEETNAEVTLSRLQSPMATLSARVVPPESNSFFLKGVPVTEHETLASQIELNVNVPGLALPGIEARSVEGFLQAKYHEAGATLVSSLLLLEEGSSVGAVNLSAAADLNAILAPTETPLSRSGGAPPKPPKVLTLNPLQWKGILATGALEVDIPDLSTLQPFVEALGPQLVSLSGKAHARASVQGNLQKPFVGARVMLENVNYVPASGASINDGALDVIVTEERIDVRNVSFNRGGVVQGRGGITGLFPFAPEFTFEASTNNLRLLPLIAASPTLDANVFIEGSLSGQGVLESRVSVNTLKAYIPNLQESKARKGTPLDAHPDVLVFQNGKPVAPATPTWPHGAQEQGGAEEKTATANSGPLKEAHIEVFMPNRAWLQGPDIQLELGSEMKLHWANGMSTLEGQAGIVRPGFIRVLGKRFDVTTAEVVYANQEPQKGVLEAEATHVTDDATVFLNVTGFASKPNLVLRSEPELSQFEMASLLLTGKTTEQFSAQQEGAQQDSSSKDKVASVAANAVANALASQVLGAFAQNTDVVLSLDMEDASTRKAKVGVGRYITDRLFISLDRNFGAEEETANSNEVRFDYRLSRRWSVEGNYGDGKEGGIDLLWKRKF